MASNAVTPPRLGRRPVLDGMRGIAVLLVVLMHTGLLAHGYVGVDVFFGLSGFLITTLLYEEWEGTGTISFRRFYERRARRLLPALFLLVGAFTVLYLAVHPFIVWPLGHCLFTTLLFANNWVVGLGHEHDLGVLSPTWSLAQEEQFYLIWPLLLWLMLRWRLRPLAVLVLLALAIVALVEAVPHVEHALPAYSPYFSPLDRSAELLLGCAGAVMWRNGWVPRVLRWRLTAGVLVCAFVFVLVDPQLPLRWVYLGSAVIAVPLIVNLLSAGDGVIARVLACAPLRYIGRISYALYLCNLMIQSLLMHYVPGRSQYFYAPIVIATSVLVAGASWHFVESRVLGRRAPGALAERLRLRPPRPQHAR